jgi:hypothetical protein
MEDMIQKFGTEKNMWLYAISTMNGTLRDKIVTRKTKKKYLQDNNKNCITWFSSAPF